MDVIIKQSFTFVAFTSNPRTTINRPPVPKPVYVYKYNLSPLAAVVRHTFLF